MKAFLIARVSTEEQREAGNSLPAQMARLEKYCQNKGFEIAKRYAFDESAYKRERDEFAKILDEILAQKEKIVVCCDKVDRLSRNIFDKRISLLYEKALGDQIELHFASEGQIINSRISAVEKFQFGISLGLAKYYSDAISDNVKRALEQKLRKGEWAGKAPWGYLNVTQSDGKKDIVVDERLAFIIKKAFELYSTGAYSLGILSQKLKDECGVVWSTSYLDKIFNNHFYYGVMMVKGSFYPHRYPPIVTRSLFEQVQKTKKGFSKKKFKYAGKPYIYRGLLRCAECGLAITPEKHKGHVYYHCTQYNGKHGAKWLREEEITTQIGDIFKRMQVPENIHDLIVNTLNQVHKQKMEFHNKQFDSLTDKRKVLTRRLDTLYIDKLDQKITDEIYDRLYQQFRTEIADIDMRLQGLQEAEDNYYAMAGYVLDICKHAHELFIGSEVEEKRQLIKFLLSNLQVEDERLVYELHKPFDVIVKCSDDQVWRP